ncbi:MAG: putative lipid II flippase FtsW [Betaproteobacteria bacterium]|nr:MAG: putative lipid II flippase FtsW [Betaproteobacteria bacterium]TAG46435.1 MAG: putative lipid II flippase FtsW [Betaproteobacteria bacterium]
MLSAAISDLRARFHGWVETSNRGRSPTAVVREFDVTLVWVVALLLAIGLLMVYSSSIASASESRLTRNSSTYFLFRQSLFVLIGIVIALFVFDTPLKTWERVAPWLFLAATVLLILVLIPGIGRVVNGARRWIPLGPFSFQPSEMMKIAMILFAARYAVSKAELLHSHQPLKQSLLRGLGPFILIALFVSALLLREPDFGATFVVLTCGLLILFMAGLDHRLVVPVLALGIVSAVALVWFEPYRLERIFGFLDPWKQEFGKGYQLTQSLMAIGRGGIFGLGLGAGVSKHYYLPEAHTDFILAVTAEELGLVGVLVVVIAYAWITWRAFKIGRESRQNEQPFSALTAQGIGTLFGIQSLINIAVNMGFAPTKGLTLPLMSYGGSGMVASLIALSILLRIDWENRRLARGFTV